MDTTPETPIHGQGDAHTKKWDENVPAPGDHSRTDFEAMSLAELDAETDVVPTEDFGNGSVTSEDDIDDSGIGSDVDDMLGTQSGQAEY